MVAPATQPAPLSYAERARRAQNIKSPIAAPPPQTAYIPLHPPPAPPPIALGGDNTSSTTTTSSTSTAPSISISTSISASASDTPNSSVILATRGSSPIPQTSFSSSSKEQSVLRSGPSQGTKSTETDAREKTRSPSSQLATKALSIVAAHTAPGGAVGKPAATVNVWSQRIERMSAARAALAPSVSAKSLNSVVAATDAAASPPGPNAANGKPTAHQVAASRSTGKDAGASLLQPAIQQQQSSSADDIVIPPSVTSASQSVSTSTSTSTPPVSSASASTSNVGSVGASSRHATVSVEALATQPAAARELVSADIWPEVGKSVLAMSSSTSGDSLRPSASATGSARIDDEEAGEDERDGNKGSKNKSKNKSKSKWVPIPAAELQAAADAANAARKPLAGPSGQRKGGRGNGNTHSNSNNTNPNSSHGNTSANNTPRSRSGRTSAAQSRSQSAQNSPRVTSTRGRRLPLEEASNGIVVADAAAVSTAIKPQGEPSQLLPNQYPHATQSQYTPHHPPAGQAPYNADPNSAYLQAPVGNVQRPHRHQHHPRQPVNPPSPSTHAFQASAAPFYPHGQMPPSQLADATSPTHAPPAPPPPGAFPPRAAYLPQGAHGPPMYPVYAPPGYGYGGWPGPGPAYMYGPSPPPHQPAAYVPQQYIDAQTQASASGSGSAPLAPPDVPILRVEVAMTNVNGNGEPTTEGEETTKGEEITPSPSAVALKEKMMFGSIDSTASLLENLELSPSSANGNAVGGGVNGAPTLIGNDVEKPAVEEGKLKVKKMRSANGSAKDGSGGKQQVGKGASSHGQVGDASGGVIPAVQASQSVQAENKWKFGTMSSTPPVQRERTLPPTDGAEHLSHQQQADDGHGLPAETALMHASSTMPAISGAQVNPGNLSPFPVALDPRGSASFAHLPLPPPPSSQPPSHEIGLGLVDNSNAIQPAEADPDLEVKDYGYGFGDASGSGYAPALVREERLVREREFETAREREITMWREENRKGFSGVPGGDDGRVGPVPAQLGHEVVVGLGEGEAGPSHGGYGHSREYGYGRGGAHGAEGSTQTNGRGRRGGGYGSGGRGYGGSERGGGYGGRRGRGMNGYSRGGYRNGYSRGAGAGAPQRAPPFTVTPPQHLMPLSPMNEHQSIPGPSYYPPPRQMASYLPPLPGVNGFDAYPTLPPSLPPANGATGSHNPPPVPAPLSSINFPLDPTRYFLLGQLEYYLSPQNMAQDFFLRRKMDSHGWIPISLIASFNRVKQLTMDVQLVRDVLTLSSIVQVRGNMVRMGGWEQFVLPDAAPSPVEEHPMPHTYLNMGTYHDGLSVERHHQLLHQQNYQSQYQPQQHDVGSNANIPWRADQQQAGEALPLVNGHLDNKATCTSNQDEEDEEDEEEDVVFVMGHESGSWSPERGFEA